MKVLVLFMVILIPLTSTVLYLFSNGKFSFKPYPYYRLLRNNKTNEYKIEYKAGVVGFSPRYETYSTFNNGDLAEAEYERLIQERKLKAEEKAAWEITM